MAERDAFITLKDYKPNLNNILTCRLISPTKLEIGRINKDILQHIVKNTAQATNVNLWRNTQAVIKWFNGIQDKQNASFVGGGEKMRSVFLFILLISSFYSLAPPPPAHFLLRIFSVCIVKNLKIGRQRQKDEHDQSSVKIPSKSTLAFILVKENWKKR